MGRRVPATSAAPLIRADFTDPQAWAHLIELVSSPQGDFQAMVEVVDDPQFDGVTVAEVAAAAAPGEHSFVLLADGQSLTDPEHPVVVVEVGTGRSFRVIPAQMWSVENNLSLANLDFTDFQANASADGVFRGFPTG